MGQAMSMFQLLCHMKDMGVSKARQIRVLNNRHAQFRVPSLVWVVSPDGEVELSRHSRKDLRTAVLAHKHGFGLVA